MVFKDEHHKWFYEANIARTNSQRDTERKALFYALGLTSETRNNINQLYNFNENCIRLEGLKKPWQTGTTIRVCRLAFNLYNGDCGEYDESERARDYTPYNLFDCGLAPYMLEAVKIRYPY